jgi:tight adherence protein B
MYMLLLIPVLFALSLGGLAYVILQSLHAGAEAYSGAYSEDTARQFEDVFLFVPPKRIAEAGWAVAAASFIIVFLLVGSLTTRHGILFGLLLGSTAGMFALRAPRGLLELLKLRRLRRFNLQLVDTLMSMSNALKAGFSITQAFESVVKDGENPIAQEFSVFLQQTRVGVSFSDALDNLEKRVGSDDLTLVVMAIETARRTGGNLTEILEKIASTIRERIRIENRIRTLTAQGRLQGVVVGSMPVIIAVALMIVDPELMLPFLHSTVGIITVMVVGVLILFGALVIRKIINIDV